MTLYLKKHEDASAFCHESWPIWHLSERPRSWGEDGVCGVCTRGLHAFQSHDALLESRIHMVLPLPARIFSDPIVLRLEGELEQRGNAQLSSRRCPYPRHARVKWIEPRIQTSTHVKGSGRPVLLVACPRWVEMSLGRAVLVVCESPLASALSALTFLKG